MRLCAGHGFVPFIDMSVFGNEILVLLDISTPNSNLESGRWHENEAEVISNYRICELAHGEDTVCLRK